MHELTFAAAALMLCVAAGSYLAGCCNGAIITSFLFYKDDIRKHGSHNAGLTNFYRVYGGKFAVCVLLLLDWRIAAVGWGLFALLWLTTRYVSLGSVSGAASFPITTLIFCRSNWTVFVLSLLIAALVIWAHRENIGRLLHGTESRFRWHTDAP